MDSDGYLLQVCRSLSISYSYAPPFFAIYITLVLRILRYCSVSGDIFSDYDFGLSSISRFIFCRIIYDKYNLLHFEDTHQDSLLDESAHLVEPMETKDHRENPTEDSLTDFMFWNRDIFAGDPFMDSQLERMVKASNPVDLAVPPRDSES